MAIVVGVVVIGGAGATYAYAEHKDVSDKIAQAERLSDGGSHSEAIDVLELTRQSWLVDSLGVKETAIINELQEARVRKQHQDIYLQSLDKLEATEWNNAITVLREIPDNSFYHDKALQKIEESNRRIIEEELDVERAGTYEVLVGETVSIAFIVTPIIHACSTNHKTDAEKQGQLRIVSDPAKCHQNETPIFWNQK